VSIFYSHTNTAIQLLQQYPKGQPFALYLKRFFQKEKKYGSKDRKNISNLCFNFLRVSYLFDYKINEDNLLAASYLIENGYITQKLKPEWPVTLGSFEQRAAFLKIDTNLRPDVLELLSENIPQDEYLTWMRNALPIYLRLRPEYRRRLLDKLDEADIAYKIIGQHSLQLATNTKLDSVIQADKEAQIQDLSSQLVGFSIIDQIVDGQHNNPYIWDCCAASGGKSLQLFDYLPPFKLWVSDVRENILDNLKFRFAKAGLQHYHTQVLDLSLPVKQAQDYHYILADVPCSGSGTWARSPEQLHLANQNNVQQYVRLQQSIVANVIPYLKPGGCLFYITCSVFAAENEENVTLFCKKHDLFLLKSDYYKGFDGNSDHLFLAVLVKN
jgi:16S rRNA (cytosine967-C5)-methyltransferase